MDTLGHRLALHATAADASDRDAVERLAQEAQKATGGSAGVAYVDPVFRLWRKRLGCTGEKPAAATAHGVPLEMVKLPKAERGFVLLPRRWAVERFFAWAARCRLVRDYECLAQTLADMHTVAFSTPMLKKAGDLA